MAAFTRLTGAPRFGEVPPEPGLRPKGSVQNRLAAARRVAAFGGLLTVASGALLARFLLNEMAWTPAGAASASLVFAGLAAGLGGAAWLQSRRTPGAGRGLRGAAGAVGTLAALLTTAALLEAFVASPLIRYTARQLAILLFALVAVPVAAELLVRGHARAVDVAGAHPRRLPVLAVLRWREETGSFTRRPGRPAALLGGVLLAGWAHAGLLLWDALATLATRGWVRARGRVQDRVHVALPEGALARVLAHLEIPHEARGNGLLLSWEDAGAASVRERALPFPALAHPRVVDVEGPREAVHQTRTLLEDTLLFAGEFAWSRDAVRLEREINRLHRDASAAHTVEERAVLVDAADALRGRVEARSLIEEERTLLARVKLARIELMLDERLLSEPPGRQDASRRVTPTPALQVDANAVVARAGLLGARGHVTYVPYWIVPVHTRWGELPFIVNALTRRRLDAEDDAVHEALRGRAPGHYVPSGLRSEFLQAPSTLGSVYAEARRWLRHNVGYAGPFHVHEKAVETVLVPYLHLGEEGWVNGATGTQVPSIREAPEPAEPAPPVPQ